MLIHTHIHNTELFPSAEGGSMLELTPISVRGLSHCTPQQKDAQHMIAVIQLSRAGCMDTIQEKEEEQIDR